MMVMDSLILKGVEVIVVVIRPIGIVVQPKNPNRRSVHGRPTWANIQGATYNFYKHISPRTNPSIFCTDLGLVTQNHHDKRRLLLGNQNHKYQEACQTENTNLLTIHMGVILVKET